jgi:hypothetical protein
VLRRNGDQHCLLEKALRVNVNDMDREVQAAVFASRVALCKKTEQEVVDDALTEWKKARDYSEPHPGCANGREARHLSAPRCSR